LNRSFNNFQLSINNYQFGILIWKAGFFNYTLYIVNFAFLIFIISGCATTKKVSENVSVYPSDYPLTDDIAYSSSTDLTVKIPQGWGTAEDQECKCIDLWLIRNDFSATLNLVTYEVNDTIRRKTLEGKLDTLLSYSKQLKKTKLKKEFKQAGDDEYFNVNGRPFAAYEYIGDEGLPIRVVVFQYQGRIFEFSAMPAKNVGGGNVDLEELFKVQQSVLSSIR
jgi:hypothetical protein